MAPNRRRSVLLAGVALVFVAGATPPVRAATSPPQGRWQWPILGPVIRGFEPPPTPFSSGHRGIDISAQFGTAVHAPADGVVTFAGSVGGSLFVTVDVGDGYLATASFLSQLLVHKGAKPRAGDVVALSGRGHPEIDQPQLHFGVRLNGTYVDPLPLLVPQDVSGLIRLAPVDVGGSGSVWDRPVFAPARSGGGGTVPPAILFALWLPRWSIGLEEGILSVRARSARGPPQRSPLK